MLESGSNMATPVTVSEKNVNTLKCVNCNIVISELLSFVQNKITVIDNESLIRICSSAFSEEEVELLFSSLKSSLKSTQKKISRRKEGKKQRNLEDIICVFKVTEPDTIPIFVARDLQKLPPVTFDHVDVTKLLKDLIIMRADINGIKENYATTKQLDELKNNLESYRSTTPYLNCNINTKKRGYVQNSVEAVLSPAGNKVTTSPNPERAESFKNLTPFPAQTKTDQASTLASNNSMSMEREICAQMSESSDCQHIVHNDRIQNHITSKSKEPTMADIVRHGKFIMRDKPNDEWISVQKRRYRNRFEGKTGKAVTKLNEKFKPAEIKIPLFISNVNKETTEDDICQYIKFKTSEAVSLEKIIMKKERSYNAFKVLVNKNKLEMFLNDEMWPDGITFRRFIHFRDRKKEGENVSQSGELTI